LYFIEYTSARKPSDYCDRIESLALPVPAGKNGNVDVSLIVKQGTQIQSDPNNQHENSSGAEKIAAISVHQKTTFQSDPNDQLASSSVTNKSIRGFDLNEIPSDNEE